MAPTMTVPDLREPNAPFDVDEVRRGVLERKIQRLFRPRFGGIVDRVHPLSVRPDQHGLAVDLIAQTDIR